MKLKNYAEQNTVSSSNQLNTNEYIYIRNTGAKIRVLFVGNSITKHGYKPEIGWYGTWGMAASCEENDYVHKTLKLIYEKYGDVDYCIAQASQWEANYENGEHILEEKYADVRSFSADVVIIRIGENINQERHKQVSCKEQFDKMVKFFASNSQAQVIVTDNFWNLEALNAAIREVVEENGYTYCEIGDLGKNEENMAIGKFEHRGVSVHPGDLGMERIAKRIFSKIDENLFEKKLIKRKRL